MFFKKNLPTVAIGLAVLLLAIFIYFTKNQTDIAYADFSKLFEEFRMTKEMRGIGQRNYSAKIKRIDSLHLAMNTSALDKRAAILIKINAEKEALKVFGEKYANEQSLLIKKRIESYSADFAKEKGYKMLLSFASGDGVIYCEPTNDVTNELLNYLNKKYEGLP